MMPPAAMMLALRASKKDSVPTGNGKGKTAMPKKRILVVSSANIDFVQRMRRVPYTGETVAEEDYGYEYLPGGKGANSAISFARFGADTVFACRLGKDEAAERLINTYRGEKIDTRFIVKDDRLPTGLASVLVEENGKNRIIVYPGANTALSPDDVEEAFGCYPDAVYMQFEIPDEAVFTACRLANEKDIPVFIDAGPARMDFPLESLGRVEVFSPNETETRVFTGITPSSEENCLRAAIKLRAHVDAKYIVIKLGDRGCFIYDGREYYVVPAEKVTPVDTTAAGDVFTAVLTYVYLENGNIVSAAKYATCAAAISVTRAGASASVPTVAEVLEYVKKKLGGDKNADKTEDAPNDEEEEDW